MLFRASKDSSLRVTEILPPRPSGEIVVPLIESIACDKPRILQVNVLNTGNLVPGIPQDFEVEVPALVNGGGIQGVRTLGLPKRVVAYALRDRVAPVEVELEAYESGDRDLLLQLLLMDPWTRSKSQAERLLERMLALPYHEDMRRHYR